MNGGDGTDGWVLTGAGRLYSREPLVLWGKIDQRPQQDSGALLGH